MRKYGGVTMASPAVLRELFTPSRPLGPLAAEGSMSLERLSVLFDGENDIVRTLNHDQTVIVGRKGSGKTTLLGSVLLHEPASTSFYLPSHQVFSAIVSEINGLSDRVAFVEQVSKLWEFVLWGIAINHVYTTYKEPRIRSFCADLNIGFSVPSDPYVLIQNMLSAIKHFPPKDWPIPEKISYKEIGGVSFLQAKKICSDVLAEHKARVYILLDSLEEYHFEYLNHAFAISGLLRCLGEFNEGPRTPVELRCCVPAEQYHVFMDISTNPIKDFRDMHLLHWKAGELIQLSAKRYSTFLQCYYEDFYRAEVTKLDLDSRSDLERFWDLIFPNTMTNRLGVIEKSVAYILRHTQLLPRHLLLYLNYILSESIKNAKAAYHIDGKYILEGVLNAEHLVHSQILEAYKTPNRDLPRLCREILKGLKSKFSWDEFDAVVAKVPRGVRGAASGTELMSTLTEIGAIGRLVGETDRYYTAVFEYMLPHKLVASPRDEFCIHPAFTLVHNVDTSYKGAKPIYTYWSGITDVDLAQWM